MLQLLPCSSISACKDLAYSFMIKASCPVFNEVQPRHTTTWGAFLLMLMVLTNSSTNCSAGVFSDVGSCAGVLLSCLTATCACACACALVPACMWVRVFYVLHKPLTFCHTPSRPLSLPFETIPKAPCPMEWASSNRDWSMKNSFISKWAWHSEGARESVACKQRKYTQIINYI